MDIDHKGHTGTNARRNRDVMVRHARRCRRSGGTAAADAAALVRSDARSVFVISTVCAAGASAGQGHLHGLPLVDTGRASDLEPFSLDFDLEGHALGNPLWYGDSVQRVL